MYDIIPKPKEITQLSDHTLPWGEVRLDTVQVTGYPEGDEAAIIDLLTSLLPGITRTDMDAAVAISVDPELPAADDQYWLELTQSKLVITGSSVTSCLYALQTFRQMLKAEACIPVRIVDYSSFSWRGFMLDCSRHFFPVTAIKRLLDAMLLHKLNRFHWHLTDDQGWRLQLDGYPALTEIGSVRKETQTGGRRSKERDCSTYRGYYSKEDVTQVVSYAASLGIEVIPEIDIPGHVSALLAAYPELSCHKRPLEVPGTFGIFTDTLCAGSPEVREFLTGLYTELAGLFPSRWVHIGGDEAPRRQWSDCEVCRAYLEEHGSEDVGDLQQLFLSEVYRILGCLGKVPIGWNEILDGSREDPAAIIQYWNPLKRRRKRVIRALEDGRDVIASDYFHSYLDQSYAVLPLRKSYRMLPRALKGSVSSSLIGFEGPLWSEWVDSEERLHWQVFPRLTAMAERMWAGLGEGDYEEFEKRLETFIPIMQDMGVRPSARAAWNPPLMRRIRGFTHLSDDTLPEFEHYNSPTGTRRL